MRMELHGLFPAVLTAFALALLLQVLEQPRQMLPQLSEGWSLQARAQAVVSM